MKVSVCIFALLLFFLHSTLAQSWQDSIVVLPLKMSAPENAKKLGSIKEGNNATKMSCDYEGMITSAKEKAKAMGGNLVKITQLIDPTFISKCYSFKADVYVVPKLPDYGQQRGASTQPATTDNAVATLYIYRLPDTTLATNYKVHLNDDSVLCIAKSHWAESFKIYNDGTITLWAQTEKRQDLKINVQRGHNYYVRCGAKNGEIRMVPVLQLIDKTTGEAEYEKLSATKTKKHISVNYLHQVH